MAFKQEGRAMNHKRLSSKVLLSDMEHFAKIRHLGTIYQIIKDNG